MPSRQTIADVLLVLALVAIWISPSLGFDLPAWLAVLLLILLGGSAIYRALRSG